MSAESMQEHRAAYKKPGMTLAESLGIDIPDTAPGGQPMISGSVYSTGSRASERARRGSELQAQGFYDLDAYGRADL